MSVWSTIRISKISQKSRLHLPASHKAEEDQKAKLIANFLYKSVSLNDNRPVIQSIITLQFVATDRVFRLDQLQPLRRQRRPAFDSIVARRQRPLPENYRRHFAHVSFSDFLQFLSSTPPAFFTSIFIVIRKPVGDYFQQLLPSQRLQQWFPGQSE